MMKKRIDVLVPFMSGTITPLDSSIYYAGFSSQALDVSGVRCGVVYVPVDGTITRVHVVLCSVTAPSAEAVIVSLRLNDTSDTLIESKAMAQYDVHYENNNLSIPVRTTDFLTIKIETPAWVTNPTGVRVAGYAVVSRGH